MSNIEVKELDFNDSNKAQDYLTHGIFRYFGKLPPTLVSKILDYNIENKNSTVLELMCGSGTTLIEAYTRGLSAVGVDINPISVLVSKVKTTKIEDDILDNLYILVKDYFTRMEGKCLIEGENYFRPKTRNLDYWFTNKMQNSLSKIKYLIDNPMLYCKSFSDENFIDLKNLLTVTYASIIRKCSNASTRSGRIFRMDEDNTLDAVEVFINKLESVIKAIKSLPKMGNKPEIIIADARCTGLDDEAFNFILNHPPYFALYKYSSDVLRFELEWCDFDRREIAKNEIEDGFKTTNSELLNVYIKDMTDVFIEARRLLKNKGKLCVVVSDSTLREEQLPVVERLIEGATDAGLRLNEHFVRKVSFAQASYHRSANPNIKTDEDHIMYFIK